MSDSDLAAVNNHEDLVACLDRLWIRADSPSYRVLEQRSGRLSGELPGTKLERVRLGRSAIGEMLSGSAFPKKAFMLTFVEVCGVDVAADLLRWAEAWDRLSARYAKRAGQAQTELAELRAEVDKLHAELKAQAEEADRHAGAIRLAAKNDVWKAQAETSRLRAEVSRLREEMETQAKESDRHAEIIRLTAEAAAKARTEASELRTDIGRLQARLAEEQLTAEKAQDEASGLRAQLSDAQDEVARLRTEVTKLKPKPEPKLSSRVVKAPRQTAPDDDEDWWTEDWPAE